MPGTVDIVRHLARWVVPVGRPPIENGCVVVAGDRIAAVGPHRSSPGAIAEGSLGKEHLVDHGDAVLMPGFVNAHTHLEFSQLAAPLGTQSIPFHDWVHLVIAHRMSAGFHAADAVALGLQQAAAAGTTTIGDITTVDPTAFFHQPPAAGRVVSFFEMIGLSPARAETELARLDAFLPLADGANIRRGISPHAPYSVHPDLVAVAASRSAKHGVPLAFHLAETREELQLLADGTGPLVESLRQLGFWADGVIPPNAKPLDYLRMLAPARRSLVVHGNYLSDEDAAYLAEHADRMTVVYCPRTHDFFGHEPHPFPRLLAAGVAVAVGTDGRCSNPDLNLHDELRFLARKYPQVSPERIVRLGTLDGARALGVDSETGSLEVGKQADLVAVAMPAANDDPFEAVLSPEARVTSVVYAGRSLASGI